MLKAGTFKYLLTNRGKQMIESGIGISIVIIAFFALRNMIRSIIEGWREDY
jgi:hypothetical protein